MRGSWKSGRLGSAFDISTGSRTPKARKVRVRARSAGPPPYLTLRFPALRPAESALLTTGTDTLRTFTVPGTGPNVGEGAVLIDVHSLVQAGLSEPSPDLIKVKRVRRGPGQWAL